VTFAARHDVERYEPVAPDDRARRTRVVANEDNVLGGVRRSPAAGVWPIVGILFLLTSEAVISAFAYPYFSLALERHGLANWAIGLNASLAGAGILFIGPFLPRLLARVGVARLAAAMYAVPFLCFGAIFVFDSVFVWFATRFIMGACFAALWATTEIWLNGVVSDDRRGRIMSLAMILYTGAQFLGPLLISVTGVGGPLPFIVAMTPLALGVIVAFAVGDNAGAGSGAASAMEGSFGFRAAFSLARSLIVASFLIGLASTVIQSLFPLFAVAGGLSDADASKLVAVFGLGEVMLVGVVGLVADRYGRWRLFRLCAIPALLVAVALPFAADNTGVLAVALFVAGGTLGAVYTLGLILIGQDFRGRMLAVVSTGFAMAYSAGAVVGATPVGYLIDVFGPSALPIAIAASLVLLAYFVVGRNETAVRHEPLGSVVQDNPAPLPAIHQREAVDVEEPVIGDLQVRDDRERKERDLEKRFLQRASETARRAAERDEAAAHRLERTEAHQTGKRQGKVSKNFAA
jgi:MFS family permease